jgi:hypothetical protein
MPAGTDGWSQRALLHGIRVQLRDSLWRIDRELTPVPFHGRHTEELLHGKLTIACADFNGGGEPLVYLGGVERSMSELEAIRAWIDSVLARAERERASRIDAE